MKFLKIIRLLIIGLFSLTFFQQTVNSQEIDQQQQRIDELNQVIYSEYDEMEGITWYNHVQEDRDKSVGFYIGEKDGERWLRFYAGTMGSDWVFFDRILFLGTFEDDTLEPIRVEIPIDSTERIDTVLETGPSAFSWGEVYCEERVDFPAECRIDLQMMDELASADIVTVRFSGQVSYRECIIKPEWVQAIIDMLDYWELLPLMQEPNDNEIE